MSIGLLESRLDELESVVLGTSRAYPPVTPSSPLSDMVADAQKHLEMVEKRPKIKGILDRSSELRKYMDPNFLDDQALVTAAKIKVIISHEKEIRETTKALETLQSLKSVLNHPAYSDLAQLREKFSVLQQKHAEQEALTLDLVDESCELLETYAKSMHEMSRLMLAWRKKAATK